MCVHGGQTRAKELAPEVNRTYLQKPKGSSNRGLSFDCMCVYRRIKWGLHAHKGDNNITFTYSCIHLHTSHAQHKRATARDPSQ